MDLLKKSDEFLSLIFFVIEPNAPYFFSFTEKFWKIIFLIEPEYKINTIIICKYLKLIITVNNDNYFVPKSVCPFTKI